MELSTVVLMLAILIFYFVLGTAMDTFGMLILSLPFVMPVIDAHGINHIWFGIFVGVMVELAAVSPPVGITVAVMRAVAPDVPTTVIFALIFWPELALWMPDYLNSL
jgi:TRAP-type C4-dicarboxylate transport system permease large subunit